MVNHKIRATMAALGVAAMFGFANLTGLASPALADNEISPTAPPANTQNSLLSPPPPHFDNDGDNAAREQQLQARYGHDRDIATPPLIVRQSMTTGTLATKPLQIHRITAGGTVKIATAPTSTARLITIAKGPSVVAGLQPADFQSPAAQFMNFAYIAMGVLVLVLVTLAVGVTSRKDRLDG